MKENIIINLDKSGKTFKRINIRYDKSSKNYFNYVLLATISFY